MKEPVIVTVPFKVVERLAKLRDLLKMRNITEVVQTACTFLDVMVERTMNKNEKLFLVDDHGDCLEIFFEKNGELVINKSVESKAKLNKLLNRGLH